MATAAAKPSFPVRRQDFEFSSVPKHWVDNDAFMTHLFNALSSLFPDGETFFVDSVRAVRDQIDDPQLQKDIGAFIGQEAMHAKEHGAFNEAALTHGFNIKRLEGWIRGMLDVKKVPLLNNKRCHLAGTVALEHFTGILSAQLMKQEDMVEAIDPSMRKLWVWHCIEENEHKAVAFDTYQALYDQDVVDYALRMGIMVLATTFILFAIHAFTLELMRQDRQLLNIRSTVRGLSRLWGRRGLFSRTIPEFLDYFKPGFHPWQHDTQFLLHRWRREIGAK
ncbi:hypothetical protein CF392_14625 [Tamilnaduibacter salinus]|uniref:Metal-dependent hydrolase n=1 Tax=Tamilnaduibacter salinus TaxID=1484056 RepID=A0A2A2HYW9_9GAMM|nr:metal-dependent hydrolase [Tamilnaduibacter salinus]PAV24761.1 hypothetical protein CF392_14625 [Tamilnaduibacter salinus]